MTTTTAMVLMRLLVMVVVLLIMMMTMMLTTVLMTVGVMVMLVMVTTVRFGGGHDVGSDGGYDCRLVWLPQTAIDGELCNANLEREQASGTQTKMKVNPTHIVQHHHHAPVSFVRSL